jgi:hypothetical protein
MKIFQLPNKSAVSWMGSGLVYMFGDKNVKKGAFVPFVTSLGIWSLGEATRGANKFRKGLGWVGLAATAVVAANNFRKRDFSKFRR